MHFVGQSVAEAFNKAAYHLLDAPIVEVRRQLTKEILSASFEITNPRNRLMYSPIRNYNFAYNLAEFCSLASGLNKFDYLVPFNDNMRQFSDNGVDFYGAYGPRVAMFLDVLIKKLKDDPNTRQAVLTIYNSRDVAVKSKDIPCTIGLHFMIRNNKLNLHTYMRSNDLIWGFQYDVVQFTLLQEMIANELGIDVGTYYHSASSLHVYDRHWELLEAVQMEPVEMPSYSWLTWDEAAKMTNRTYATAKSINTNHPLLFNGNDLLDSMEYYLIKKANKLESVSIELNVPKYAQKIMKLGDNIG